MNRRSPVRAKAVLVPAAVFVAASAMAACAPPKAAPPPKGVSTTAPSHSATTPAPTTLPPIFTGTPRLYKEQPLDGWGQDNIAYAVKIVGNTVYVGGDFSHGVHHSDSVPRSNTMAVSLTTGALSTTFVANTNGVVYALASDGRSLFLGGTFTNVNGVPRSGLAKVNLTTGAVDPTFTANTKGEVDDLLVVGTKLYAVGIFSSVNGMSRGSGAAVDTTTGALDSSFDLRADARGNTVASNRDHSKLYVGGVFLKLGTTSRPFLAEVDPVTGHAQGPSFSSIPADVRDVTVRDDGSAVYAAVGGKYNSAVELDPTTGHQGWRVHVDGDTQAIASSNGYVYMGFHDGYQGNNTLRLLAVDPDNGQVDQSFMPVSGGYPGVLTLDANGKYLVSGGLFPQMGGVGVKGLSIHPAT